MTLKERWNAAEYSEITAVGRMVLIGSILMAIIKYIIYIASIANLEYTETGMVIALTLLIFLLTLLGLILLGLVIFGLGLIVFWIIGDYKYDWYDVGEVITTAYKVIFGDYKGKYDFLMEQK